MSVMLVVPSLCGGTGGPGAVVCLAVDAAPGAGLQVRAVDPASLAAHGGLYGLGIGVRTDAEDLLSGLLVGGARRDLLTSQLGDGLHRFDGLANRVRAGQS